MADDAASLASGLATLRDLLQGLSVDDADGPAAEKIRETLAARGLQMTSIASVAEAVAAAVDQRATLIAQRDATMPTDEEIHDAEQRVLAATAAAASGAGSSGDIQQATDALASLLARKRVAEKSFQDGGANAAQTLDNASTAVPDPGQAWMPAVSTLGGMLSGLSTALPAAAQAFSGAPMAQESAAAVPQSGTAPTTDSDLDKELLSKLVPSRGGEASVLPSIGPTDPFVASDIPGRTHTSADLAAAQPSLSGVHTGADVSGRPANPFIAYGSPASNGTAASGASPMAGAPMLPMSHGAGMGHGDNAGVAPAGKRKKRPIIENRDATLAGDDIATQVATSGVVGRDDETISGGRG